MEVALLQPFLELETIFSLSSEYLKNLKKQLYLMHKNMKIPLEELNRMPVDQRMELVLIHNMEAEKEINEFKKAAKK